MFEPVTRLMAQGIDEQVFPGAVLLFSREKAIIYHQAFGVADLGTGEPVIKESIFDLASLTKPLASTLAVLYLIKKNKLSFDTTLDQVFSATTDIQVPKEKAGITIDMLLRHSSGLPAHREYFRTLAFRGTPSDALAVSGYGPIGIRDLKRKYQERLRKLVLAEPLESSPGATQVYSDLGFILLCWIVEMVSGKRLDTFAAENIYLPLDISRLGFRRLNHHKEGPGQPRARVPLVSTEQCPWRKRTLKGEVHDDNAWISGGVEGHAGLFGDARGVHRICCAILDALYSNSHPVIDPLLLRHCVQKKAGHVMAAGFDTPSKSGSSSGRFFSSNTIGHLGYTGTSFWIDPKRSIIVILLTNRVHPSRNNMKIKMFRPLIHDQIMSVMM
ncbi:MAG: class A beta-lactamase-related serine hydrolase [Desulfobacteraceae bacterium]|nr:MAG: class A beta-lactamase-related serine hydrolase [Desulfobacteraceae bacterium]